MSMRIFSKLSLQFDHPTQAEQPVLVKHDGFATVPGWVKESKMFKLALSDGSITVIESKSDEVIAEHGDSGAAPEDEKAAKAAAKAAKEAEKRAAAEKAEADALALAAAQNQQ